MKTRYLVFYSEDCMNDCMSAFVDESTVVFKNKDKAKQYCKDLNKELADWRRCKVKDLSDRYYFIEIEYIK